MTVSLSLSLLSAAALQAGLAGMAGVRAEGWTSSVAPEGYPNRLQLTFIAVPSVAVVADANWLTLTGAYSPRARSSDFDLRPEPTVSHELSLRLQTHESLPWRVAASGGAFRGRTDPLEDPLRAATSSGEQLSTLAAIPYEWARAGGSVEWALDARTRLAGATTWVVTRAVDRDDRALFPTRSDLLVDASLGRRVSPRDTVRLAARGRVTDTATGEGRARAAYGGGAAILRHALTPRVEGWGSIGVDVARNDFVNAPPETMLFPAAELGATRGSAEQALHLEATARLGPYIDRFTGELNSAFSASGTLGWRAFSGFLLRSTVTATARTDGETAVGVLDTRAIWTPRERLTLEAGFVGRYQSDRRPEYPSFIERAAVVAVAIQTRSR